MHLLNSILNNWKSFLIANSVAWSIDANKAKVAIYPNPTTDYLKISSDSSVKSVVIFDISGRKVTAELVGNTVDVQKLVKGSYLIKITDGSGTTTQKFIKE